MMITDRLAAALATLLAQSELPGDPSVVTQIDITENDEESARVIVVAGSSELRKPSLPGNYDVLGEVTIFKTIDQQSGTEDLVAEFQELCDAIEEIVGMKYDIIPLLRGIDPKLEVYSWNLTGQASMMQERAMGARFSWAAFARQDNHNPN
jgi:hypothetical protein